MCNRSFQRLLAKLEHHFYSNSLHAFQGVWWWSNFFTAYKCCVLKMQIIKMSEVWIVSGLPQNFTKTHQNWVTFWKRFTAKIAFPPFANCHREMFSVWNKPVVNRFYNCEYQNIYLRFLNTDIYPQLDLTGKIYSSFYTDSFLLYNPICSVALHVAVLLILHHKMSSSIWVC